MAKYLDNIIYHPDFPTRVRRTIGGFIGLALAIIVLAMLVFDHEPATFSVVDSAIERADGVPLTKVTGYVTTATVIELIDTMLNKRGGYLTNDIGPPGALMDNVPNWEWGVLVQIRDVIVSFRNDFSRSQSQSTEDTDLIEADNRIRINNEKWMLPAAESEYGNARDAMVRYLNGLSEASESETQFFARADNLYAWLAVVEKRLGDLSQRLSASVGQVRLNTDLAGDPQAEQSTDTPAVVVVKTGFLEIDDVFYEARGGTWALIHLLRAVEHDFESVLAKKNALVSLRQIIRELEGCQDTVWSPVILNGKGFGFVANHSLVMASYISRAHAAIIDLKSLLERG